MSISRKIIGIIWTITLLVSLPGCINFKPDVQPLEVSGPNSTSEISTPQGLQSLLPVPGITPNPFQKPSYVYGIELNPYNFHGCPVGSQEQINKKCGGGLILGWEEYDGKFRAFLDGDCRVLDPAKDAAAIELIRNGITNMIDADEKITQYEKNINSGSVGNAGSGVATIGGAIALLDCVFGTKAGCGWLVWAGGGIAFLGGGISYYGTNKSVEDNNNYKQIAVDARDKTKVTIKTIFAPKMQCPKP